MGKPDHPTRNCRINNLPYDTLYIVFVMCWDEAREERWGRRLHWPVIASHVCQLWRQYALDTPDFWAQLLFDESPPRLEKYHEWFARLKNATFDVYISWQPFTAASVKHAKAIMRLIMPHISHLRSLCVGYVPLKILRVILNRLSDANAPSLQRLGLNVERSGPDTVPESLRQKIKLKLFHRGQVPSLKEIELDGLPHDYVTTHFGETLSTFKISPRTEFATPQDNAGLIQRVLLQAPGLRAFGFFPPTRELQHAQAVPNPPLPTVHHASLQEIFITGSQPTRNMIICSLALPRIRYFLDKEKLELSLGLPCLRHLGLGPFPSLISLRLRESRISWLRAKDPLNSRYLMHLSSALEALPELRALTFQNVDFEHDRYLIKCLGSARCCPRLQWLTLLRCLGYTLQELRSVVEARRRLENVDALVRVTVYGWAPGTSKIHGDDEARDWLGQAVDFREIDDSGIQETRQNYLSVVEGVQSAGVVWYDKP
ncbi:hypothetical protein FRC04_005641 [Tulasnella sp. 424]|nr:hypothetical protein FRC04_005641 [Tulasnella sp. 424]